MDGLMIGPISDCHPRSARPSNWGSTSPPFKLQSNCWNVHLRTHWPKPQRVNAGRTQYAWLSSGLITIVVMTLYSICYYLLGGCCPKIFQEEFACDIARIIEYNVSSEAVDDETCQASKAIRELFIKVC